MPKTSSSKRGTFGLASAVAAIVLAIYSSLAFSQSTNTVFTDIDTYRKELNSIGRIPNNEQGTIGSYVSIPKFLPDSSPCSAQDICPDVILLDTPVHKDPNLDFETIGQTTTLGSHFGGVSPILGFDSIDHGTAMAGIIAARTGLQGLVGIYPDAKLFTVNWSDYASNETDRVALVGVLSETASQRKLNPPVIVLASGWQSPVTPQPLLPCSSGQRFPKGDALARFLSAWRGALIVVAAGNHENPGGLDITRNSQLVPQDLGDCDNVIVVTACTDCTGPSPRIPDWANYSTEGLVQIAAYGDQVLTIKGDGYLTEMPGGTSAAAAFVGGVASAMIARWPAAYDFRPADVKFRLQLTSKPVLVGQEAAKLSAGILDPNTAVMDPNSDYLQPLGGKLDAIADVGWCVDQIAISKDGDAAQTIIDVAAIYRIYCPSEDRCTVFHSDLGEQQAGIIERSGPGPIRGSILAKSDTVDDLQDVTNLKIFAADGTSYSQSGFVDIILHAPRTRIGSRSCK